MTRSVNSFNNMKAGSKEPANFVFPYRALDRIGYDRSSQLVIAPRSLKNNSKND